MTFNTLHFKEWLKITEEYIREPNTQYGSNPGGIFRDSSDIRHYIKFPKDPEQAKVEVATSKIFNHLGIRTLSPEVELGVPGKIGVKTKWDDNLTRIHPSEFEEHIKNNVNFKHKILDMYHASALMNNRDVVGQEFDNILLDKNTREPVSVDQGGSMHFRAMGEPKEFTREHVPELTSMLVPRRPTGHVFHIARILSTPEEIQNSRDKLNTLTDDKIDHIINESGLDKEHAETIKSRRDVILKRKTWI